MSNIVPFGYSFQSEKLPVPAATQPLDPGKYQAVHITCTPDGVSFLLNKIEIWFDEWDEVILVSHGISSKTCQGFIVLEWEECFIDRLFLQILQHEATVLDFSVYIRNEEV